MNSSFIAIVFILTLAFTTYARESLQDKLDTRRDASMSRRSEEAKEWSRNLFNSLESSGILNRALNVGDKAPNFTLQNATGDWIELDKQLEKGPAIVVFYRGGWCPYCNITLAAYEEHLDKIKAEGAQLIAISPESPDKSLTTKEKQGLSFEVLSDPENGLAKQFNIAFQFERRNGSMSELPLAATYVIDTDRTIRYAYLDVDYTKRAEPSEIINELAQLY